MSRNRLLKNTKLISLILVPLLLASIFAVPAQASTPDFETDVFVAIKLGKKIVASEVQYNILFTDPGSGTPSAEITVTQYELCSDQLYTRVIRKYGTQFTVSIPSVNTPGYTEQEFLPIEHGKKTLTVRVHIYSNSPTDLSLTVNLDPPP